MMLMIVKYLSFIILFNEDKRKNIGLCTANSSIISPKYFFYFGHSLTVEIINKISEDDYKSLLLSKTVKLRYFGNLREYFSDWTLPNMSTDISYF